MCPLTQGWTSAIWSEAFDAVQMFIFRSRGTKRWSSECKMFLMPSRRLVSHPQSSFSGKCPAGFHWFHSKKKRKKSLGTLFPHGYISKILVSQWNMNQVMRKSWISGSASQDPWSQHLSGYTRRHFLFSQAFGTGSKHHPAQGMWEVVVVFKLHPVEGVVGSHLPYIPVKYCIHNRHREMDLLHLVCLICCRPEVKGKKISLSFEEPCFFSLLIGLFKNVLNQNPTACCCFLNEVEPFWCGFFWSLHWEWTLRLSPKPLWGLEAALRPIAWKN